MAVCPWCAAERKDPAVACPVCGKGGAPATPSARPVGSTSARPVASMGASAAAFDIPDLVVPAPAPSRPRVSAPAPAKVSLPAPQPTLGSGFDDDFALTDGGDLQLDLGGAAPAAAPGRIVAPPDASGLDPFDDALADDGVKLDLADIPPPRQSSGSLAPISHRSLGPPSSPSLPSGAGGIPSGPPSGPLPVAAGDVDPFEARALADFGPPPEAPWLTPRYAIRVTRRQGELLRALAERRAEA